MNNYPETRERSARRRYSRDQYPNVSSGYGGMGSVSMGPRGMGSVSMGPRGMGGGGMMRSGSEAYGNNGYGRY